MHDPLPQAWKTLMSPKSNIALAVAFEITFLVEPITYSWGIKHTHMSSARALFPSQHVDDTPVESKTP